MAQLLTCPNRHHWDLTDDPFAVLPRTRGLCPLCGEPPTADSPVDWDHDYGVALAMGATILVSAGVFLGTGFVLESEGHDVGGWHCISGGITVALGALTAGWYGWRRRWAGMKAAADAVGFAFAPTLQRARAEALGLPPFLLRPRFLVDRHFCIDGTYHGSRVLLVDALFRTPPDRAYTHQTVVLFPEPVPGLPDFQVEPAKDESKLRNRSLDQLLGRRPLNPLREEPFGRHYRLGAGTAADVLPWLSPELRDVLERRKGWVLGAWRGQFYLYHRGRYCRADACATFVAVAWRMRDMLAAAAP